MPPIRQGAENLLNKLVSFVKGEVAETREGIQAASGIKKMLPLLMGIGVVLIIVTLARR